MDLIKRMLHLDPDERIKSLEVLQHPFLTRSLPESCSPGASIEEIDQRETPEVNHLDETAAPNTNQSSFENTSVIEAQSETWEEEGGKLEQQEGTGGEEGQQQEEEDEALFPLPGRTTK